MKGCRGDFIYTLLATALLGVFFPHAAYAEQVIHAYSSHIEIKTDGSADVQEEVVYDFGQGNFHGIYRVIPLSLRPIGGVEYNTLDISSIAVTDGRGNRITTKYDKGGNSIKLTIGEPDTIISGPQLYVIRYTLTGGTHANLVTDQFDWDVTGGDWQVPIEKLRAELIFPDTVLASKIVAKCIALTDDGRSTECGQDAITATSTKSSYSLRYQTTGIGIHTHFLIQASFPKGAIIYKTTRSAFEQNAMKIRGAGVVKWWQLPFIDFSLIIPFIVFFAMLSLWVADEKRRRKLGAKEQSFLITGGLFVIISFFIARFNLALLASGLVILLFTLLSLFTQKKGD